MWYVLAMTVRQTAALAHGLRRWLPILSISLLSACAGTPEEGAEEAPTYWSFSKVVDAKGGMITLFDPRDLAHHEVDPPDWYIHDFAFSDDLLAGRMVAMFLGQEGPVSVRITNGPLNASEQALVGPRAQQRLRVIGDRLLLAGGDAWPSVDQSARSLAYDQRLVGFTNGEYRVLLSALLPANDTGHDYVIQLLPVADMMTVTPAPGIPKLVYGQPAAVVGVDAPGFALPRQCGEVPGNAHWAALSASQLPIPGMSADIDLPRGFHDLGLRLKAAGRDARIPIVVSRSTSPGSIGVYIAPDDWRQEAMSSTQRLPLRTRVLCAVEITGVNAEQDFFKASIRPISPALDRLPSPVKQSLKDSFGNWIRLVNDPAFRFKSGKVQRTFDDRSLTLGLMHYLSLTPATVEELLRDSNAVRADKLLEQLGTGRR